LFEGLLSGFLSEAGYNHIAPCIADLSDEAELVVDGVESMLKKT